MEIKLGQRLKILREEKGLTQKQLADELSISQSYISRLEKRIISNLRKEFDKAQKIG